MANVAERTEEVLRYRLIVKKELGRWRQQRIEKADDGFDVSLALYCVMFVTEAHVH
jgi:N-acyl-L-homoserine lactone synthetase